MFLARSLIKYREALAVRRYELESYYVLLDIGRVEFRLGNFTGAIRSLEEYLGRIDAEMKVLRGETMPQGGTYVPDYTQAGMEALLSDRAEAAALIVASKASLDRLTRNKL
jgi:hypothetical protein